MGKKDYNHFKVLLDQRNAMDYWWSELIALQLRGDLDPVIIPKTFEVYPRVKGLSAIACLERNSDKEQLEAAKKTFNLVKETIRINDLKYPLFMRTSLGASKHEWENTCFVSDESKINKNLHRMLQNQLLELMVPLPEVIFLREFMNLQIAFHAFVGKMPISREFRIFSEDGDFLHIQPYWPEGAIESPDVLDWKLRLFEINKLDANTELLLVTVANRITKAIGGSWSIDFCHLKSGKWAITDMAVGLASFLYNPYHNDWRENKPTKEEMECIEDYETLHVSILKNDGLEDFMENV